MAYESTMPELGASMPGFTLSNTNHQAGGTLVSTEEYDDAKAMLVVFICNHCPYVVHIKQHFSDFAAEYVPQGLAVIAISSNDANGYPQDGPDAMAADCVEYNYGFPYLYDEDQQVARAYQAVCTPDFFLFDGDRRLVYRGQYDDSRPRSVHPLTGADLRAAVDAVLAGENVNPNQKASVGCSIKWKP